MLLSIFAWFAGFKLWQIILDCSCSLLGINWSENIYQRYSSAWFLSLVSQNNMLSQWERNTNTFALNLTAHRWWYCLARQKIVKSRVKSSVTKSPNVNASAHISIAVTFPTDQLYQLHYQLKMIKIWSWLPHA